MRILFVWDILDYLSKNNFFRDFMEGFFNYLGCNPDLQSVLHCFVLTHKTVFILIYRYVFLP